jgi:hypothetical protein
MERHYVPTSRNRTAGRLHGCHSLAIWVRIVAEDLGRNGEKMAETKASRGPRPTPHQLDWLQRGLDQPGGKLPLFDRDGQEMNAHTVRSCLENGWAEPWFHNFLKPDWLVCKLSDSGRLLAEDAAEKLGSGNSDDKHQRRAG